MSRRPRQHVPGGYYHVTLRGNHRQDIFRDPADRSMLAAIARGASERTGVRILAYCWMTNHIHLVTQVDKMPLGHCMQIVGSRYARHLQRRCATSGHLFERRYHAVLIAREHQLLHVVRYVHLNPVRAGLVPQPADYPWSSHRCYLGANDTPWVRSDLVLRSLAPDVVAARQAFAHFCGEAVRSPECTDEAREMLRERPACQPGCRPGPGRPRRTLDAIVAAVCDRAGVSEQMLASPGKCRKFAVLRGEIAASAFAEGAASLTDVARRFNRDLSSISQAATRWRRSEASANPHIPNPVPLKV